MKKLIALLLATVLCLGLLAGCAGKTVKGPEGTMSEIIDKVYAIKEPGLMGVMTTPVDLTNADTVKYMTGLDDVSKVKEAAVSEPMVGSQAYSLVMVRVNDAKDTEAVAKEMQAGINPNKWICVMADDMKVVACGDVIMLIMVSTSLAEAVTAQQIVDAFKEVCGGTLSLEL